MAAVSGDKAEIYTSPVLEDLVFSRQVRTQLCCDKTVAIMMVNSNLKNREGQKSSCASLYPPGMG